MSFEPTDLHWHILDIVHDLQHKQDRRYVEDDDWVVVFDDGVPASIIYAEVLSGGRPFKDAFVLGAIDELTTRGLLESSCSDHSTWPRLEYRCPNGRIISTSDPRTGVRDVFLDEKPVATEEHPRGQPTDPFARLRITREGLAVLDSDGRDGAATGEQVEKRREHRPDNEPSVVLGRTTDPVNILGKEKPQLTMQQYDVVKSLLNAGERGLTKDELVTRSCHTDARGILKRLADSDPDWEKVISFAGRAGGGYRIRL
jgi:hypothetical protein